MQSGGVGGDHGEGDAKVSNPQRGGSTAFEILGLLYNSCTKTLRRNKIYSGYCSKGESKFFYDGSYEPCLWIHNSSHAAKYFISPKAAKQRYISFDNLRECLEMKIYLDGGNGSFSVLKMPRIR